MSGCFGSLQQKRGQEHLDGWFLGFRAVQDEGWCCQCSSWTVSPGAAHERSGSRLKYKEWTATLRWRNALVSAVASYVKQQAARSAGCGGLSVQFELLFPASILRLDVLTPAASSQPHSTRSAALARWQNTHMPSPQWVFTFRN